MSRQRWVAPPWLVAPNGAPNAMYLQNDSLSNSYLPPDTEHDDSNAPGLCYAASSAHWSSGIAPHADTFAPPSSPLRYHPPAGVYIQTPPQRSTTEIVYPHMHSSTDTHRRSSMPAYDRTLLQLSDPLLESADIKRLRLEEEKAQLHEILQREKDELAHLRNLLRDPAPDQDALVMRSSGRVTRRAPQSAAAGLCTLRDTASTVDVQLAMQSRPQSAAEESRIPSAPSGRRTTRSREAPSAQRIRSARPLVTIMIAVEEITLSSLVRDALYFVEFRLVCEPPGFGDYAFDPVLQSSSLPVKSGLTKSSSSLSIPFKCGVRLMCDQPSAETDSSVTGTVYAKRPSSEEAPRILAHFSIPLVDIEAGKFCVEKRVPLFGATKGHASLRCLLNPQSRPQRNSGKHLDDFKPSVSRDASKLATATHDDVPISNDTASPLPNGDDNDENRGSNVNRLTRLTHRGTLTPSPRSLKDALTESPAPPDVANSVEFLKLEIYDLEPMSGLKYFLRVSMHKSSSEGFAAVDVVNGCEIDILLRSSSRTPVLKPCGRVPSLAVSKGEVKRLGLPNAGLLRLRFELLAQDVSRRRSRIGLLSITLQDAVGVHALTSTSRVLPFDCADLMEVKLKLRLHVA